MNKKLIIYIAVFVAVVGLMMYLEYNKPKPIDWRQSYSSHDKIPYGSYVLSKEIPKIFPEKKIQFIENKTVAANLSDFYDIENSVYFILQNYNSLSQADQNELLEFVKNGNDVFLITNNLPKNFRDSLNCEDDFLFMLPDENSFSSIKYCLSNASFGKKDYYFSKNKDLDFFSKIDTANTTILGYFEANNSQKINFIKQSYGEGNFYINLCPKAFSNYYLLNDSTYSYSINCINYIDKNKIFWDEYKKSINLPPESILSHIFNNPPLYWAWIILLIAGVLYLLFFGKRTQRIIPIIKPLQNTSVEFTQTIGNLYFNNHQHNDLIAKKIKYFLFFVKEKYFLNIEKIDSEFGELLHLKSGVVRNVIDNIVFLINKNKDTAYTTEADLREVNSAIDAFYHAIK
ncbi:MAG: DUF4350 domain-containing protein [Paludibacter sp.]|nr:DUF4350 domain-containing protein [Paludibacter sp.]